jgi:hypothetical protein
MLQQEPFNNTTSNIDVEQAMINICNIAKVKYNDAYQTTKQLEEQWKIGKTK